MTITYVRAMEPGAITFDEWLAAAAAAEHGCPCGMPVSGKGGIGKSWLQLQLAAEASCLNIPTLLVDTDPERNLSYKQGHGTEEGLGAVLTDAGALTGDIDGLDPDAGAKRLDEEIKPGTWPNVWVLPAGRSLNGIAQVNVPNLALLRAIFLSADLYRRFGLILIDTPGRTGHLTSMAMYAASRCYAIATNTSDSLRKVGEARRRVEAIQESYALGWAGTVLTNFGRDGIQDALHEQAKTTLAGDIRMDLPPRSVLRETFELAPQGERLGDRRGAQARNLSHAIRSFLLRDVMQLPGDNIPEGVLL